MIQDTDIFRKPTQPKPPYTVQEPPKPVTQQTIPKKTAAVEVLNRLKIIQLICTIGTIGPLIVLAAGVLSFSVSAVISVGIAGFMGWYLFKAKKEMAALQFRYGLK